MALQFPPASVVLMQEASGADGKAGEDELHFYRESAWPYEVNVLAKFMRGVYAARPNDRAALAEIAAEFRETDSLESLISAMWPLRRKQLRAYTDEWLAACDDDEDCSEERHILKRLQDVMYAHNLRY